MPEQKLNSEQKDETQLPSSPNNAKPDVIGSQCPPTNVKMFPFLEKLCDAMWSYGLPMGDKIVLELSEEPYNRFLSEFNSLDIKDTGITIDDIVYAGMKFCVKKL